MPYKDCHICGSEYPVGARGDEILNCRMCGEWTCQGCATGDGEDFVCFSCQETCPKCGDNTYFNKMIGDETMKMCSECGYSCGE